MAQPETYFGRLELWTHDARMEANRVLRELNLIDSITITGGIDTWTFEVPAITADQYDRVIDELVRISPPADAWNFTLD